MSASKQLTDLPEELLGNVAARLSSDDAFALRLTNRATQEKSFHEFATRFFSAKCVHLTTDSLSCLVRISTSRLANYVKTVSVVPALFSELGFKCPGRAEKHWKPSVRQAEAYKFWVDDQKRLKEGGRDLILLSDAFKGLRGLKNVALIDVAGMRGEDVDYRGAFKVLRMTGTTPIDGASSPERTGSTEYRQWLAHVWLVLLRALAYSEDYVALDSLRTDFLAAHNAIYPRQLNLTPKTLGKLANVLRSVSTFQLHLKGYQNLPDAKKYGDSVAKFAGIVPNVTNLTLQFDSTDHTGYLLRRFLSQTNVANLKSLEMCGLAINSSALAKIVSRLSKVEDLKFSATDLTKGSWPEVLEAIAKLDRLEHLHLMYLKEGSAKAYFLRQNEADLDPYGPHEDGFDDGFDDGLSDYDDDEDDDETDDELPDLEPVDGPHTTTNAPAEPTSTSVPSSADPPRTTSEPSASVFPRSTTDPGAITDRPATDAAAAADDEEIPDYVPFGTAADYGERGFYICVSGHARILRELRVFVAEYNVGDALDDIPEFGFGGGPIPLGPMPFPPGMGPFGGGGGAGGAGAGAGPGAVGGGGGAAAGPGPGPGHAGPGPGGAGGLGTLFSAFLPPGMMGPFGAGGGPPPGAGPPPHPNPGGGAGAAPGPMPMPPGAAAMAAALGADDDWATEGDEDDDEGEDELHLGGVDID